MSDYSTDLASAAFMAREIDDGYYEDPPTAYEIAGVETAGDAFLDRSVDIAAANQRVIDSALAHLGRDVA